MADNELLDVQHPENATRLTDWYLQLFNEDPEFLFNHAQTLSDGYAVMGTTIDDFRQMLVADDFRFLRNAADQNNDDIDELIISVFEVMEDTYPGFTDTFREAAPELGSKFISDGITLGPPDNTSAPNPHPDIVEPAAPPAAEEEAASPDDTEEVVSEPEAEIAPEPEAAQPPPGSRGNPFQPRIEIETPAISYDQIIESVQDIQTQLENLPEDPAERQEILNGISNTLKNMAITLTPTAENDARLSAIPPRGTNDTFEGALETLDGTLNTILRHDDTSGLTDYLVRGSQQAGITAREAGELIAPEVEAAPAEIDVEAEIAPEVTAEPAAPEIEPIEPSVADIIMQGMERTRLEMEAEAAAAEEPPEAEITEPVPAEEIMEEAEPEIAEEPAEETLLEAAPAEEGPVATPEPTEAETSTELRLSEFLDGRGYHNDTDGYTDYNALEGAFSRAAELGITTEHIENIRVRINSPEFILQTSSAIAALDAYNQGVQAAGEQAGLTAFFNAIAPEDFVRDLENSIDDNSVYDQQERDQVREATLRIEDMFKP